MSGTALELFWNSTDVYDLWSWTTESMKPQVARIAHQYRRNIYAAVLGPKGGENEKLVLAKIARGTEEVETLAHEATIYTDDLRHLQGTVIPVFYGLWKTKIGGIDFACMFIEHCTGPTKLSASEFNYLVMVAACKIHQAGITHNDLARSPNHVVLKGENEVRIVDFSGARRHKCRNAIPTLVSGSQAEGHFCIELVKLEQEYGIHSDSDYIVRTAAASRQFWGSYHISVGGSFAAGIPARVISVSIGLLKELDMNPIDLTIGAQ